MDAVVDGNPVVYRAGALVELNALWYAALRWVGETAPQEGIRWRWNLLAHRVISHFKPTFWQKAKGYLADWVDSSSVSWQIRPNQLWAAAVPFRPISDKIAELVVETVETHLLTPRGLRTLSPMDPQYIGTYQGDQATRDRAYHNGSVWPFLLGAYADALLGLYGDAAAPKIRKLYESFAEALWQYGWGYIAEIYEGDAPHLPRGAPAQAWSIAELLRIAYLLRL
jgi:predicted glycogen debranching enzyme